MPKKFIRSFNFAHAGTKHVLQTQRNIWIHLGVGFLVLLAAFILGVSRAEMAVLVLTIAFVLVVEMLNTALEELVNLVKPEAHPLAGLVKNIAAGAVLVSAGGAILIGLIIFIPRLI